MTTETQGGIPLWTTWSETGFFHPEDKLEIAENNFR